MSKKTKEKDEFHISKKLNPDQRRKYKQIGKPNLKQNWLEIFTDDVIDDLFTIMHSCSDNQRKADYVERELSEYGFQYLAEGTNIVTLTNPVYPGVVFKVALDECGIADNFNDCILQHSVPRYARVFARHPSAIVSVQQRYITMTALQMSLYRPRILGLLKELSKYFLVADLSPDRFLNYGIDRDGDFVIMDGSDLYPLHQIKGKLQCKRIVGEHKQTGELKYCEGKLEYSEDFQSLVCKKCGREHNPLELRPRKEAVKVQSIMRDGLDEEARSIMEQQEIAAIRGVEWVDPKPQGDIREKSRTIFVHPEEDGDEAGEGQSEELSEGSGESDEDDTEAASEDLIPKLRPRFVSPEQLSQPNPSVPPDEEESTAAEDEDDESADSDITRVAASPANRVVVIPEDGGEPEDAENDETDGDEPVERLSSRSPKQAESLEMSDDPTPFVEKMKSWQRDNPAAFAEYLRILSEATGVTFITAEQAQEQEEAPDDQPLTDEEVMTQLRAIGIDRVVDLLEADGSIDKMGAVTSESANNNIPAGGEDDVSVPPIRYRVTEEVGNPDQLSGILLDLSGCTTVEELQEAYEEYGLPLFITVDGGKECAVAIRAGALYKGGIEATFNELLEEHAMLEAQRAARNASSDDEDEGEDPDEDDEEDGEESILTRGFRTDSETVDDEDD